jgi:hypothetical protein
VKLLCLPPMVLAVPLEQHLAGSDVDLLHDAVNDRLVRGAADRREIRLGGRVREDQGGVRSGDQELVAVRRQPVAGVACATRSESS